MPAAAEEAAALPSPQPPPVFALIHVHTTLSDGTADPPFIAARAARAGVEVVILTDHNRLSPGEGIYPGGVLVIAGQEVTPRYDHLLVLGLDQNLGPIQDEDRCRRIRRLGGWAALAHPLDSGLTLSQDSHSYAALDYRRLDHQGLELWNVLSAFKRGLHSPWLALARMIMPRSFLAGPHPLVLALWDTVGRRRPWPALGGADAHAFATGHKWLPFKVYSYRRHMGLVTTGLWLSRPFRGDFNHDRNLVLQALARGHCFVALGPARGFRCRLLRPSGPALWPGSRLPWQAGLVLEVKLPARGRVRLLCQGREVARGKGRRFSWPLEQPGVWRVEARRLRPPAGWRPWIYCNPFYLRGESA